ncbi:hypothetical protein GCM10022215_41180 [Nocardioides fonticola]|uniref:Uncharacterized protein n=1 Tax=Nocardioides fonticola TaxID=450363 RepID=A0ABP7Y0V3_9ACTN
MQVGTPSGPSAGRIRYDDGGAARIGAGDHSQQLTSGGPLPASDAGPDGADRGRGVRARGDLRIANHRPTAYPSGR